MNDDAELLRRYAREGANDAFAAVVRRHVNLVYSAALRQLNGDAHLAADATQLVFTDLARKASTVAGHRVLAAWLFTSTRYVTAKIVRGERRRQAREKESQLMQDLNHDDPAAHLDWERVRPVLDDVIGELNQADREAILLRFFEGRDYASVGARLQLADNTARMRVDRALDKLRTLLERRGVKSTSAAIATALAHQAVLAAPAGLAATVAGVALGAGAVMAGATGSAVAALGTFMSVSKIQIGLAGVLAATGATGLMVQAETNAQLRNQVSALREEARQVATLQEENSRRARLAAELADLRQDDARLAQLRDEAAALQTEMQAVAAAQARAAALRQTATASRQALSGPLFEISTLDRTPKATFQARPSYPAALRTSGTGGDVVVDFVVDDKGAVQHAFALRSSQREFESPAVEAVSKWKFEPGAKGGLAVNTHMQVPIVFKVAPGSGTGLLTWPTEKPTATSSAPWF